jgi:hypothetical protein
MNTMPANRNLMTDAWVRVAHPCAAEAQDIGYMSWP